MSCAEMAELIEISIWELTRGSQEPCSTSLTGRGAFQVEHLLVHFNVPTHECIASAVGISACSVHMVHEFIRCQLSRADETRRQCGLFPNYFEHLFLAP